jgi:Zn-dependent protease with chaperone function
LLSTLGYAYPVVVLTGLLATMAGVVLMIPWVPSVFVSFGFTIGAQLFAIPLLALSFAIVRSLWVSLPPPEGRPIARGDAPQLFELCDLLRKRLRGPRIHQVLVTDEFNAGIVQVPRLGLLGWPRNYLVIGLPMALALSPEQFEAVLAHEYGHLAGAHGRFSARIYQMRQTWVLLATALEKRSSWGAFLFAPFFNWYAPYFNAYSFVLARAHEYEADRCASDVVGPRVAADALIDLAVREEALERHFWPGLWKHANQKTEPPYLPYQRMGPFFKQPLDAEFAQRSLRSILAETTGIEDTHPSLADRIKAMGQEVQLPGALERSAAEHLFDQSLGDLVGEIDKEWRKESSPHWQERYQQISDWRRELAELGAKAEHGPLDADQRWRQATLTEEVEDTTAALPLYRSLLQTNPKHAGANFAVGRIMLEEGDVRGLDLLEAAMEFDEEAIIPACELAYQYLMEADRKAEAQSYIERAQPLYELQQLALAEQVATGPVEDEDTVEETCRF